MKEHEYVLGKYDIKENVIPLLIQLVVQWVYFIVSLVLYIKFNDFGAVVQKERQRKALNKKAKQKLSTKTIILIPIYLAPIFLILSKISIVNGMQSAVRD